jgi:hypothetical protein
LDKQNLWRGYEYNFNDLNDSGNNDRLSNRFLGDIGMTLYVLWVNPKRARLYTQDGAGMLERVLVMKSKKFRQNSTTYGPHFYADFVGVTNTQQVRAEAVKAWGDKIKQVVEL